MIFSSHDVRPIILWVDGDTGSSGAVTVTSPSFPSLTFATSGVTLDGTSGNDLLEGSSGDDLLRGLQGDDTLFGYEGADTLLGGGGNDVLYAGDDSGDSSYSYSDNLLKGGAGDDSLFGSGASDTLLGEDGNDWIETGQNYFGTADGGDGHDTIIGTGDITGGDGQDRLVATGSAKLGGGAGDDALVAAHGATLTGGDGADGFVFGEFGVGYVTDFTASDYLVVEDRHVTDTDLRLWFDEASDDATTVQVRGADENRSTSLEITGGLGQTLFNVSYSGNDTVLVPYERTELSGTTTSDAVIGTATSEKIIGGGGKDTLTGNGGNDLFVADLGRGGDVITDFTFDEDRIDLRLWGAADLGDVHITYVTPSQVIIRGATGQQLEVNSPIGQYNKGFIERDFVFATDGADNGSVAWVSAVTAADAPSTTDSARRILGEAGHETIDGANGADSLFGGAGNDTISGRAGDDLLWGDRGKDLLIGNNGHDTALGLLGDDTLHGGAGNDVLEGGVGNDHLFGNADDDLLRGGNDDDILNGGAGADTLRGGAGSDTLTGGTGQDVFVMRLAPGEGQDVVTDFVLGEDDLVIHLNGYAATSLQVSHLTDDGLRSVFEVAGLDASVTVENLHLELSDLVLI